MTKLSELQKHYDEFEKKAHMPIKAAKGGDTWVKVQQTADRVAAAVHMPMHYLDENRNTREAAKRDKFPSYIKTMHDQLRAIDMTPVTKYIKEHGEGGAKKRGLLSTAAAKADEKKRVALAGELVRLMGLMQIEVNNMKVTDL